ncbi:uncharacterized protein MELLADRAFT_114154 [Melampsora larici-populina 98AG31]|uniref:Mediator of RNA polymerase II transcription subunit 7 n=1 Tax=Melampsora larici-populina (strain 98AG31 / pathotype 3-4-7) TaxID=747676 RepID=F4SCE3_MELLP|nr:uncharacterized protein MELLADRAFT_114154 [Melampsora larici-populina 98AG31]EGF97691.1 hypothetical protein MELLADRAFT_114154 [Melampsora larici-populina 98AG31]
MSLDQVIQDAITDRAVELFLVSNMCPICESNAYLNPNFRYGYHSKRIVPKLNRSSKTFNPKLQKQLIKENCQDLKEEVNEGIHFKTLIEPPNLDFIEERGGFTCFGDWETWPGKSSRAMLEECKEALQALLNTLFYSYLKLLNQLSNQGPPSLWNQSQTNQVSKIDQIISHIKLTPFNMHGLCNEIRPRQTIEGMHCYLL